MPRFNYESHRFNSKITTYFCFYNPWGSGVRSVAGPLPQGTAYAVVPEEHWDRNIDAWSTHNVLVAPLEEGQPQFHKAFWVARDWLQEEGYALDGD